MTTNVIAALALFGASAHAFPVESRGATGSTTITNSCSYPIYMQNTPSAGGGQSEVSQTIQPGSSYTQGYTALSNGNGWSMKLSKTQGSFASNVLQYEYTYQNAGRVWFDMSAVNGDPLSGNWHMSGTGDCSPSQVPYTYPTEDKVVPEVSQSCSSDNSVTVTLCSK